MMIVHTAHQVPLLAYCWMTIRKLKWLNPSATSSSSDCVLGAYAHGVVPRSLSGLQGILFAPWLHASLGHIVANTGGLLVLGWLCMWPRISLLWEATAGAMLGAGLCAWLFGASGSVHIGASGLVFGYAGYLVARGYYTRKIVSILVALLVISSFGLSMLLGVLPLYPGLSWQRHLGGLLGGVLVARLGSSGQSRA
ncbi:rhomboid family intramembrane serine protease [Paraburkholderia strydomiana]|uniref:rhomboid family intramembrane serine protease n=1 Tax=Paraburkholderia strydomiana TaxID=1245417 RepID=UPI0038BDB290